MNTAEFNSAVDAATDRMRRACEGALYLVGSNIMTESKRLCPVDLGTLRGSGYVTLPQDGVVELGYGGPAADYAVIQHEDTSLNHDKPRGKHARANRETPQAKFLQRPVDEVAGKLADMVSTLARRLFDSNRGASKGPHPLDPWQGPRR